MNDSNVSECVADAILIFALFFLEYAACQPLVCILVTSGGRSPNVSVDLLLRKLGKVVMRCGRSKERASWGHI